MIKVRVKLKRKKEAGDVFEKNVEGKYWKEGDRRIKRKERKSERGTETGNGRHALCGLETERNALTLKRKGLSLIALAILDLVLLAWAIVCPVRYRPGGEPAPPRRPCPHCYSNDPTLCLSGTASQSTHRAE